MDRREKESRTGEGVERTKEGECERGKRRGGDIRIERDRETKRMRV